MRNKSLFIISTKFILKDLLFDFLYWPIWWYTIGLRYVIIFVWNKIIDQENFFGVRIWITNLFVPMFGQYDWQGRIISFFVRLLNIIARILLWFIWILLSSLFIVLWIVLPPLSIFMTIQVLFSLFIFEQL